MSTNEIICLSSEDDESDHSKVNGKAKELHDAKKGNTIKIHVKRKRLSPSTVNAPETKRINLISPVKKGDEDTGNDNGIQIIGIIAKSEIPSRSSSLVSEAEEDDDIIISESPKMNSKPLLVIKEKHPVHATNGRQDIFSMFLSQCLLRDKSADMRKIVEKLKRKYEQLDPNYAHSDEFAELLNEKRNCLMADKGQVYKHIAEINDEMKSRKKRKNAIAIPSCSSSKGNDANIACDEENEDEKDCEATQKRNRKIRAIEKAMLKVEKRIKEYEESEVDLDDEDNSTFLISDRYKRRMVELYAKWCELTGNLKDAGRTYLRPIHLKLTGIVTVDQAINSFINSNLAKKTNPSKKQPSTPNTLVFPDYVDISKLLHAHNVAQNLGMDAKAEKATAKAAFIKLGEYLKSVRQRDFYDTFSVMYEHADDPATKHEELMAKLRENRDIGEKKLNAIFDEYSKKQEVAKSLGIVDDNNLLSDKEDDDDKDEEEDEEMDEGDDERLENDSDLTSYHDSDATIRNSDQSSDDEAIIIDQHDGKSNNKIDDSKSVSQDKTTESKVLEGTKVEEIPIESLKINLPVPEEDSISKVALPNNEKVNDDEKNLSPISTNTANKTNIVQATIDEVNIVPLEVEDSTGDLCEKTCAEEKPMLKLRSFAKPPGFWQNSQEMQDDNSNELVAAVDSEPIEIIELDRIEKRASPQQIVKNTININISPSNVQRRISNVPLTSTNKDVKIFRRLVTIPALKLTPISKSNIEVAKIPSVGKNVIIHPNIKLSQSKQTRLVPLSSIEIRNQKSPRPVAHIVGQRKITVAPIVNGGQNVAATNSKVTHTLCINPIAKGVQVLSKICAKPSTTTSCIKSIPILTAGKTVKYLELKALPQKVINPLVKQQQNIENVMIMSRVAEYKKNVTNTIDRSNFIKR